MDTKRLAIGTVVGAIALYLVGILIFDILFAGFYEANLLTSGLARESQVVWALAVGALMYALLIALLLEALPGSKSIVTGLWIGFVVGLLNWGTADFTLYGITNIMTTAALLVDPLLEGVRGAIAGAIMVLVLGLVGGGKSAAT